MRDKVIEKERKTYQGYYVGDVHYPRDNTTADYYAYFGRYIGTSTATLHYD